MRGPRSGGCPPGAAHCAGCAYELGRRHVAEAEERLRQRARDLTAKVKELEPASGCGGVVAITVMAVAAVPVAGY